MQLGQVPTLECWLEGLHPISAPRTLLGHQPGRKKAQGHRGHGGNAATLLLLPLTQVPYQRVSVDRHDADFSGASNPDMFVGPGRRSPSVPALEQPER